MSNPPENISHFSSVQTKLQLQDKQNPQQTQKITAHAKKKPKTNLIFTFSKGRRRGACNGGRFRLWGRRRSCCRWACAIGHWAYVSSDLRWIWIAVHLLSYGGSSSPQTRWRVLGRVGTEQSRAGNLRACLACWARASSHGRGGTTRRAMYSCPCWGKSCCSICAGGESHTWGRGEGRWRSQYPHKDSTL